MSSNLILNALIWLPLVAGLGLLAWPRKAGGHRALGLAALTIELLMALSAWSGVTTDMAWIYSKPWVPEVGIMYSLGLDGVNLILVVLIALAGWLGLAATGLDERLNAPAFTAGMLLTVGGMMGTAMAQDLFLFYVFWELMLLPFFLMIGFWGGEKRIHATLKFAIMTIAGSLAMFAAILYAAYRHFAVAGTWSFALSDLLTMHWTATEGLWLFAAFAVAFAIKAPVFPLHTWQPDTYVEAPYPVTFVLAAAMSKLGIYGFIRFAMPLFPAAAKAAMPVLMTLAAIGVVYGALLALVQKDAKRLVAYASFSHLGLIAFGVFAIELTGVQGGLVHMLNHGLTTGGIFLVLMMVAQRTGTTEIAKLGGLGKAMPVLTAFFLVITFGSIGLPGLNGFVGEFLLLLGGFTRNQGLGILTVTTVIIGAAYMLWMVQRAWFGPTSEANAILADARPLESLILVPVVALTILLGLYPRPLLEASAPGAKWFIDRIGPVPTLTAKPAQTAATHHNGGAL